MYIIEKIIKTYLKLRKQEKNFSYTTNIQNEELEDILTCKHNFMPIDSTGNIFACSKCGYVVTKKRLEKYKNFFKYQ